MIPTVIVASIIAALAVAVIVVKIIKKKKGISSCSCGGDCSSCKRGCGA